MFSLVAIPAIEEIMMPYIIVVFFRFLLIFRDHFELAIAFGNAVDVDIEHSASHVVFVRLE